ncbi:MAG: invasion associated locus B family protein [Sulfitobacter sp.]|jgi:invasion protein IalB
MTKFLTALPLYTALAVFAPAATFAQTATTDGAVTVITDEEAAAPKTEDLLSLGEDATQESPVGKPYTREVIGEWEMRCIKGEEAATEAEPCQMYQLMNDAQGVPVAEISLFRLPSGNKAVAGATIIVPLETSLPSQMTLSIDGGKARRYPYAFCNPIGCYVRLGLTQEDVAAFKRGNEAVMTIVPALAPDQKVQLKLSLSGFTASFDKSSVLDQ